MTCNKKPRYIVTLSNDEVDGDNEISFELREHEENNTCVRCLVYAMLSDFLEGIFNVIVVQEEKEEKKKEIIKALYFAFMEFIKENDKYIFPKVPENRQEAIKYIMSNIEKHHKK
jgi:hypothetical protein